ncbi:MAG: hypothetical protein R6V01_04340 [Thermoplasmatota archaeon]
MPGSYEDNEGYRDSRMSMDDGTFSVNCSGCTGAADLGSRECFNCISAMLVPGFNGPLVLRGHIDRRYHGHVTDIIFEHSDILRTIRSMREVRGLGLFYGMKVKKVSLRMEELFLKDLGLLVREKKMLLRGFSGSKRNKRTHDLMEGIIKRSDLLMRRLAREVEV